MTKLTTWQATIQDDDTGAAIVSPVVTVRLGGPAGAIADLFDIAGAPIANPVTGGLDGFVQFQVRPGRYWVQAADGGTFSTAWYVDAMPEEGLCWETRAELVADVAAGMNLPDGTVVSDGTVQYVADSTATAISDLPGWLPFGQRRPAHDGLGSTVGVPGDVATMQEVINRYGQRPVDKISINIEAGHSPASGISVYNGDYSDYTITSVDAVVSVDSSWSGPLLIVTNARSPTLDALFDIGGFDPGSDAVSVGRGSFIYVTPGSGAINSGGNGLVVSNNSKASAFQSLWTGASLNGISVQTVSSAFVDECDAQNCRLSGLLLGSASTVRARNATFSGSAIDGSASVVAACITVDRSSQLDARGAICQNSGYNGAWVDNSSNALLRDVDTSNAANVGFFIARGATASVEGGTANGCATGPLSAQVGARVNGNLLTATGYSSGQFFSVQNSTGFFPNVTTDAPIIVVDASVDFENLSSTGVTGNGFSATDSDVSLSSSSISSASGVGLIAISSSIRASLASFTGNTGRGVDAQDGSHVVVTDGQVSGNGTDDVRVATGSQVFLNGTTTTNGVGSPSITDVNLSSFNAIQGNFGIIWN